MMALKVGGNVELDFFSEELVTLINTLIIIDFSLPKYALLKVAQCDFH